MVGVMMNIILEYLLLPVVTTNSTYKSNYYKQHICFFTTNLIYFLLFLNSRCGGYYNTCFNLNNSFSMFFAYILCVNRQSKNSEDSIVF